MNDFSDVIVKPITTEKTTLLKQGGTYVFKVSKKANKISVRRVLEKYFSVNVERVNIVNTKPKIKVKAGRSKRVAVVGNYKKAYVTLKKGLEITELEA